MDLRLRSAEKHVEAVLETCCLKDSSQSIGTPRHVIEDAGRTDVLPVRIGIEGLERRRCNEEHHKKCVLSSFSCSRFDFSQSITESRHVDILSVKEFVDEGVQLPYIMTSSA